MPVAGAGNPPTARKMAVSSATLFVASPRYSNPSYILPLGDTSTTPEPAGPGLPEHAPSVYATQAPGGGACGAGFALPPGAAAAVATGSQASSLSSAALAATSRFRAAAR